MLVSCIPCVCPVRVVGGEIMLCLVLINFIEDIEIYDLLRTLMVENHCIRDEPGLILQGWN